jgi:hypothetical protein
MHIESKKRKWEKYREWVSEYEGNSGTQTNSYQVIYSFLKCLCVLRTNRIKFTYNLVVSVCPSSCSSLKILNRFQWNLVLESLHWKLLGQIWLRWKTQFLFPNVRYMISMCFLLLITNLKTEFCYIYKEGEREREKRKGYMFYLQERACMTSFSCGYWI